MAKREYTKREVPYINTRSLEELVGSFVADAEKYFVNVHAGKKFGIKFSKTRSYTDEKKNWNLTNLKDSQIHILEIRNVEVAKLIFKEIVQKYNLKTTLPKNLTPDDKYLMLHL